MSESSLAKKSVEDEEKLIRYIPIKYREQVKNPVWKLDDKPDVIDVLFRDIIHSYDHNEDTDIFAYKQDDYLDDIRGLYDSESNSLDVRISHDLIARWKHWVKPPPPPKPKKRTKRK